VVVDSSGAAEKDGYQVHVLSTGPYKGTGAEGAPITDDQLGYLQQRVNDMNTHFIQAVAAGRGRPSQQIMSEWGDGKVWIAAKAQAMGLIDGIAPYDQTYKALQAEVARDPRQAIGRAERIHRIAELS
jgi:ClpP class serine protease